MKKWILLSFVIIIVGVLAFSIKKLSGDSQDSNGQDYFNAKVLKVYDKYVEVECLELTTGAITTGTALSVPKEVHSKNEVPDMQVGAKIRVVFTGVLETYPPQLQTVWAIYPLDEDGNVTTVKNDMSVPENADEGKKNWGITLSVKNVTESGLTLICTQSGGEPTGELQTGSDYHLIVLDGEWKDVPTVIKDYGWNTIAYMVPKEESTEFEINWEWLYGKLPAGTYRIIKGFTDFRESGDFDTETYWAEFEIKLVK